MSGATEEASSSHEEDEPTSVLAQDLEPPRARRCPACGHPFSGGARFCPFDGDVLVDAPDWNPSADALLGQVVDGRYEVLRVLGEGGMGTVYEVRHLALGRLFALKLLRREGAQDGGPALRFVREAKAAAAIGHPNIVTVSDFGELAADQSSSGGRARVPYFVMERLVGTSLAKVLAVDGAIKPRRAAHIVAQCASALAAAHDAGVIHRDMKPDNIFLVDSAGKPDFVKILDFGVAKIAGAGRLTRHGSVFGTPHYMSPEQAAGSDVDARTDIYALGVILYECLAGKVPFEADTYMGVLTKHMFAAPEPLERLVPDSRGLGALGQVVMRCLAKEPERRYASMREVGEAIALAIDDPEAAASVALRDERATAHGLHLREPNPVSSSRRGASLPTVDGAPMRRLIAAGAGALLVVALLVLVGRRLLRDESAGAARSALAATSTIPVAPPPSATGASVDVSAASANVLAVPSASSAPLASAVAAAATSVPAASGVESKPVRRPPSVSHAVPGAGSMRGGDLVDPWGE